jgi:hypothetical protein
MKKAASVIGRELVRRTPVDTGRARTNWLGTVGEPANFSTSSTDYAAGQAEALRSIDRFKLADKTIYLTNNLTYIQELEDGKSAQAPRGMAKQATAAGASAIRGARIVT